jgi:hypothetical protein
MARYYFHIGQTQTPEEADGEEYASLVEAKESATKIARELGRNRREAEIRGQFVRVTDEQGREVFRTAVTNK